MKIRNVLNPIGIRLNDFKNPEFQEGLVGGFIWCSVAFAAGIGVGLLLLDC